jgi:predicted enzyme related to lactoylglutathione lyase
MANRWSGITIDCQDVQRVAAFWSALLDRAPGPTEPGWVYLGTRSDTLPRLVFQPVAEPKIGKNRLHIDVEVDDIDAGIDEVLQLGGSVTGERHDYDEGVVVVMRDVEDNEFCLVKIYDTDAGAPYPGATGAL